MSVRSGPTRLSLVATAACLALAATGCGSDSGSTTAGDTTVGASTSTAGDPSSSTAPANPSSTPAASEYTYAVYDVGSTPQGPRLYREFRSGSGVASGDASLATALTGLSATPDDPDYGTLWADGLLSDAHLADGQIDVTVDQNAVQRPSDITAQQARIAVQQVVYTLQAAAQRRLPVRFLLADAPTATVLGVSTSDPVAAADELATLALVNVTTPEQGQSVSGAFTASGVASTFEGSVPWTVLDSSGRPVLNGSTQTEGDYTSLSAWKVSVDASALPAGDYTFVASTGRAGEGPGPTKDTKAFTVS